MQQIEHEIKEQTPREVEGAKSCMVTNKRNCACIRWGLLGKYFSQTGFKDKIQHIYPWIVALRDGARGSSASRGSGAIEIDGDLSLLGRDGVGDREEGIHW